jgi:hypothetical protein
LNEDSGSFVDGLFFRNDFDPATATRCSRLENEHVFEIIHLSFVAESLIVLWEQVGVWTDLKILSISSPLSLHVAPQVSLVTNVPSACKMIDFLKLIHVLEFAWPNQTGPEGIPGSTFAEPEAGCFECIDDAVVGVGRVVDPECQG